MGDLQGYLLVQTAPQQPPRECYVTLRDNVLSYARAPGEAALEIFILRSGTAVTPDGTQEIVVAFGGDKTPLVLHAPSPAERNKWLAVLQRRTSAGAASPARRLSRRITVDFDDDGGANNRSSIVVPPHQTSRVQSTKRPMLSLDVDDDIAPPEPSASTLGASAIGASSVNEETAVDVSDSIDCNDDDLMKTCMDFSSQITPPTAVAAVAPAAAAPAESGARPKASNPFLDDQDEIAPPDDATQHQMMSSAVADPMGGEVMSTVVMNDVDLLSSFIVPPSASKDEEAQHKDSEVSALPTQEPEEHSEEKHEEKEEEYHSETSAMTSAVEPPAEAHKEEKQQEQKQEKEPETQPQQPAGSDTFVLPGTVEDSMVAPASTEIASSFILPPESASTAKSGLADSFVIPPGGEAPHKEGGERSYLFASVSESKYGNESVIVPSKAQDNPLLRQYQQMQGHAGHSDAAAELSSVVPEQSTIETPKPTQQQAEQKHEDEKKEPEKAAEKEPEWKIANGSYVEVKDPAELRLLLKWGLPAGTTGIFADGIMIDFDADVPPHWSLNPRGRIRLAMTKQETLDRLRAKIVEAQEKGDTAMLTSLMQRHREVAASEEPEMTCFHFCDDLKLCYRAGEWVVMNKLPPAEQDPGEWLEHLSESLGKFFSAAGKSLRDFLGRMATAANEDLAAFAGRPLVSAPQTTTPATAASKQAPASAQSNPRDDVLADLEKDVDNLLRVVSTGASAEERAALGSDATNPRVAVLVRAYLCTDLARIAGDGFRTERRFGTYHIWDWVESYGSRRAVAAPSVEALALGKAVATVAALRYDKSAAFRAFVCRALSEHMLGAWLDVMVADAEKMGKFFAPTAMLRTPAVLAAVRAQLARLSGVPFALALDFEARGRMIALARPTPLPPAAPAASKGSTPQ